MKLFYPLYLAFPATVARAVQVIHTTNAMAHQGIDVHFLSAALDDTWENIRLSYGLEEIAPENWQATALPSLIERPDSRLRLSIRMPYDVNLKRYIKRHAQPGDAVFVRERKTALNIMSLAKRKKLKLIYEAHHLEFKRVRHPSKEEAIKKQETKLYSACDAIITVNQHIAEEIKTIFTPPCPITVAPNGFHPGQAFTERPDKAPESYLFYSGQLYPRKGVDTLVQAMAHLPNDHLIIAGGNRLDDVERIARKTKLHEVDERVTLIGQLPQREVAHWGQHAKALMLPNTRSAYNEAYTCPIKLMEYMSYGKPIVASDLPTVTSVITGDTHAVLVEPGDPEAIAAGVRRLDDTAFAQTIAHAAQVHSQQYTWAKRAEIIIEAIQGL
jgi:glycosyltransferase involved in cell wall biosynthesis